MTKSYKPFDPLAWLDVAVSEDIYRPILAGVYRDAEAPDMFVATDTHRMHVARLDRGDAPLEEVWSPGVVSVRNPKIQKKLNADRVPGTYPAWRRVMPFDLNGKIMEKDHESKDFRVEITVNAGTLLTTLEGLKTSCKNNANRMMFKPDQLCTGGTPYDWLMLVKTMDVDAAVEFTGKFACDVRLTNHKSSAPLTDKDFVNRFPVAFNILFLIDALKGTNLTKNVTMQFWYNSRAMQITYEAHPNITAVIMPMAVG